MQILNPPHRLDVSDFSKITLSGRKIQVSEEDSSPININGSQIEYLAHSHPSACHQFQDETVSLILRPEDDLIYGLLFCNLPRHRLEVFEDFSQYGRITRLLELLIPGVYEEGEECTTTSIRENSLYVFCKTLVP